MNWYRDLGYALFGAFTAFVIVVRGAELGWWG